MLSEIPPEQFAAAIDECTREMLAGASIVSPPVDALLLAKRLGLVVARDSSMEERARYVCLSQGHGVGQGTILLADEARTERRQWAIAHEVGESAAHQVFAILDVSLLDIPTSAREAVANHLANSLLLPREWFARDGSSLDWDLLQLKEIYTTASHELIARRMLEMRPSIIVTLFDQGRPQWRRSNSLGMPPRLTAAETDTWLATHECNAAAQYESYDFPGGIEDIRCWPVHEPEWKREIMRTALGEW